MAKQRFLNNFTSTFIAAVKDAPSSGTPETELDYGVLRISDGAAGSLINPTDGDYYLLTAFKRSGSVESNIEVMRVTGVNNATPGECRITVQRAQEGTSAKAFVAGDYLSLRITKGTAENFSQPADLATKEPVIGAPVSSPTEKYWRGDKTWRDFFTDVRAATLTELSTATSAVVDAADSVLVAIGKLQAQIGAKADAAAVRERLSAPRTYYVRTDGNDANTGLSNTAGGAFATIQKAWDTLATLDGGGHTATIQVADGTYSNAFGAKKVPIGFSSITIVGNAALPAQCHISTVGNCITVNAGIVVAFSGLKLSSSSGALLLCQHGAICVVSDMECGSAAASFQMFSNGGRINVNGNMRITGNALAFACAQNGGGVGATASITLVGTPAFTWFVRANDAALVIFFSTTIAGSATGSRYFAQTNGVINTSGAGASYLPGNTAGTVTTGGQYL